MWRDSHWIFGFLDYNDSYTPSLRSFYTSVPILTLFMYLGSCLCFEIPIACFVFFISRMHS